MDAPRCPPFLHGFPGIVLQLAPDGTVLDSNGRFEHETGHQARGRRFRELLDGPSSLPKWERILAGATLPEGEAWELILHGGDSLPEPRAFSALRAPGSDHLWLVEHPRDPRAERLGREMVQVNTELARTQRALAKEKAQLVRALAETERLSAELRERNRQLEALAAELERSNDDLDQFAHVASHDLKAPLRHIRQYAEWVSEDLGDRVPGDTAAHLERIRVRAADLQALVEGVLEYARAGRGEGTPEPVDVRALAERAVRMLPPPDGVRVRVLPGLPTLRTSGMQLQQVLLNLVGNALRHARSEVRIGARETESGWEFRVEDDGPGVPPEARNAIWNLFGSLPNADGSRGSGIGLAVVKKLVERQGGRAWVESEPGSGASFRFRWPERPGSDI